MKRGKFISFEGIDGAGKSSQIEALRCLAEGAGHAVRLSREPGGTQLGERLRELLLHQPMAPDTELALMVAARTQHLHEVIGPTLEAGTWLLCDRFNDATFAYQGGGRGLELAHIAQLDQWMQDGVTAAFGTPLLPDRTYIFDLDPNIAAQRRAQARSADRFEQEDVAFFNAVRRVYLDRAKATPSRYCIVDANQALNEVAKEVEKDFARYCL
jgi:dTMP kinase